MNPAALSLRQFKFEFKSTFRNRSALIFTFLFPIMFLLVFGLSTAGKTESFDGHSVPAIQFFVPGIIAYGLIGTSFTGFAIRLTNQRDAGILKRVAGTPMPRSAYVAAQILTSIVMGFLISAITLLIAKIAYGVNIYADMLPALTVDIVIGSGVFCALGLAAASVIPNADAAPGIVNGISLPILFISDVFYSVASGPKWLGTLASIFPVKHLANALQTTFDPTASGTGFNAKHLVVLCLWGIGAAVFASWRVRLFRAP